MQLSQTDIVARLASALPNLDPRFSHFARTVCLAVATLLFLAPDPAYAYIGPGAGFAFLGSTFVVVLTVLMAMATIALWPLQFLWRKIRGKGVSRKARTRRVVVVGLDGLEPSLVDKYIAAGKLPNLRQLSQDGSYQRLGTTLPALSPVAWSTFQTGVNPGAHNIFDFLTRDKRVCLPQLASVETNTIDKLVGLWPLRWRRRRAEIRITRKSKPFWKILGDYGVFSNVIRVPISYPPEKFGGNILSAMCTPDLKGTQGSFTFFTTDRGRIDAKSTGGQVREFKMIGAGFEGLIEGPPAPNGDGFLTTRFEVHATESRDRYQISIGDETETLKLNEFSRWIPITFAAGNRKKVHGICRFCLRSVDPHLALYVSPINVDPEKPALPIAQPIFFASWLAKRNGPYGTLGLMEDTWGRNELALDDARFLEQSYLTHDEREKMFFDALSRTKEGLCACVFDASDRIQHMFWRYLDPDHPSPRESGDFDRVIPEMYEKMDGLVGRVRSQLNEKDVLIVLSDHGFASFRRCINLNTWLMEQGYLATKSGKATGADYFQDIDWSKTKAFAVGLSGLYINRQGREAQGIVSADEAETLKAEISRKLEQLNDPANGARSINKVHDTAKAYRGLYTDEAPDLIVGYAPGYRISWDSITGTIEPEIFSDNLKAWSGDHHVDPKSIPGILLTNRKIKAENPHIVDIAPTVLDLFAVKVPPHMEGKVLF